MMIRNISDIPNLIKKGQSLLGIDYGSKIIGIAVSDEGLTIASPLISLTRTKLTADIKAIAKIVIERHIGGFVIGMPKNMDGKDNATAQAVRAFARSLTVNAEACGFPSGHEDMPIVFWDERLSTAGIEKMLIRNEMSRLHRSRVIDKMAAAYILQGALDCIKNVAVCS
ncbi:MAG: Holliday junction resolvase RuvX [Alphaproteobacteria bacterium]|nr:Holliday junction resolvase RuvX [Alphaproteobacteria bacterium]MCL2504940.1 Holliday junction resolvase RuvX [Alphaproteobacteria bacterium]